MPTEHVDGDDLLRLSEVGEILHLGRSRVSELTQTEIPAVRLSKRCVRVRRRDLERWIESRRGRGPFSPTVSESQNAR